MVNCRSNGFGLVPLTPILIYLIISALIGVAVYFIFNKKGKKGKKGKKKSGEFPLGLGKKQSFTENFVKSTFGETPTLVPTYPASTRKPLTEYPDGTKINVSVGDMNFTSEFPDGTNLTHEQQILSMILGLKLSKMRIFFDGAGDETSYLDPNLRKLPESLEDANEWLKHAKKYKNYMNFLFYVMVSYLIGFGDKMEYMLDYCDKNIKTCEDKTFPIKQIVAIISVTLNTDILGEPGNQLGAGYDEYEIDFLEASRYTELPINFNFDKNKKIRFIAFKYFGKEDSTSSQTSKIIVNATDTQGKQLIFNSDTSFYDNRQSYNYNLDIPPYDYPITLSDITVTLTCPGKYAAIKDFSIIFVYD